MNPEPISFIWPLTGGLLVGLSAAIYLLVNGRVTGISGLTANATGLSRGGPRTLSLVFIVGLLAGAALSAALLRSPEVQITSNLWLLIAGGLIVGFGTRWGSGCTSGHGVCGLARLSRRSMVATAIFMAVAALTVFAIRHLLGSGG